VEKLTALNINALNITVKGLLHTPGSEANMQSGITSGADTKLKSDANTWTDAKSERKATDKD
jgi:hypothetical protein